jgi:pimeloyl-ACP methyl ester carboxylesterase
MPLYSVDGTNLYFEEHGTGEPLVLVHGAWVAHHSWDAMLPLLSRRFRVVVYDLRGHGRSAVDPPDAGDVHDDVSDLVGLLDHLALGPANILGISSGACIVLRTAVEQPRVVRRVLVHDPPYMQLLAGREDAQPYLAGAGEVFGDVGALIGARDHAGAARRFWDGLGIGISWESMSDDMRRSLASHAPAFGGQMNDPDAIVIDVDQQAARDACLAVGGGADVRAGQDGRRTAGRDYPGRATGRDPRRGSRPAHDAPGTLCRPHRGVRALDLTHRCGTARLQRYSKRAPAKIEDSLAHPMNQLEVVMRRTVLLLLSLRLLSCPAAFAQPAKAPDTVEMKRAPVKGGEIEYEIRGNGEPVLLIHGALIADSFLPMMDEPALANYRVIRYHRRGYAGSTAPAPTGRQAADAADGVALLRHLGIERAHIVGHSGGGRIALQLTLDAPEVVHSLTLIEPSGLGPVPGAAAFAEEVAKPAHQRYRAGDAAGAVDIFLRGVLGPNWRAEIASTLPGGPEQAVRDARADFGGPPSTEPQYFDKEQLSRISQPVLYVWGTETFPVVKEVSQQIHRWIPAAEVHTVPGVGHGMPTLQPRAAARIIVDFLRGHPLSKASR